MKKRTLVEHAKTPDGKTLALFEHDGRYTICVDGLDLMSTRLSASEEKLAEITCTPLKAKRGARVLIGGLGCGFTLRTAMACLGADAEIIVAEIMPEVIAWNKNPKYPLASELMKDPRVVVVLGDVADRIREAKAGYDAIMLDVDNGPAALAHDENRELYQAKGLKAAKAALRPGGCVAYWSAVEDPPFAKLMGSVGLAVEVQRTRSHSTSGGWHTIFLGRVGAGRQAR